MAEGEIGCLRCVPFPDIPTLDCPGEPDIDEGWTEADDVIEEVREIRRRISARFDDDPSRLAQHYMKLQKRHADRLENPREVRNRKPAA